MLYAKQLFRKEMKAKIGEFMATPDAKKALAEESEIVHKKVENWLGIGQI
jgi:hypothetical protein